MHDADRIEAAIFALLDARAPDATICPSEAARAASPDRWRRLMPQVRDVARQLARAGRLELRQRGAAVLPDEEIRGPIRLARPTRGRRV
ncbi:MAG: DUF3253 domain-containing protein [Vicinamibacterales bacterium]